LIARRAIVRDVCVRAHDAPSLFFSCVVADRRASIAKIRAIYAAFTTIARGDVNHEARRRFTTA
jgi:hypothetical protein